MAEPPRRRGGAALGVVGAVTIGAVSAAFVGPPALADDPEYPSWADVQRAKSDQASVQAEADRITAMLGDLQDRAEAAGRTAAIAAEHFHRARMAEDAARARHAALASAADASARTARTSRMRAGLLAASVARGSGAGLGLLLDADRADDLLRQLSTVSQLSAQSDAILQRAVADRRDAEATGAQADAAATVLTARAETAQEALGAAQRSAAAATEAVSNEQRHADRLIAQLATLRGTSTRVAAQYADGVRAARQEAADRAAAAAPSRTTPPTTPSHDATPAPDPTAPADSPAPDTGGQPGADGAGDGRPAGAQAAKAVAYARDQIGEPYRFGGAGPDSWDCSGLTMQAYAAVGIQIGGHSATAQYRTAASQDRLVPYSAAQVGDLVFYTDGGGDMYHVAIYSGGGMMIEAPYPGASVREVPVRGADRVGQVARPSS